MPRRLTLLPALLALLVIPAPARAASPGINVVGALGDSAMIQRAVDTGAREVRFFVDWGAFEASGPKDINSSTPDNLRDGTFSAIRRVKQAGRKVMIVMTGAPPWANGGQSHVYAPTPAHVGDFARFTAGFVHRAAALGTPIDTLEVWNEPDGGEYWKPGPDPALYASLLKATYAAVKAPTGDPNVRVFAGPTTGNNYPWIQGLYDNGAKGSFDGVSVHTDTACLVTPPDSFYRDSSGRLAQYTFLGYREVRATMLANGDDKPIAMSELGWSSTGGGPTSCARGTFAGQKANGVSAVTQALDLTAAFGCLANDPYVVSADWFQLGDTGTASSDEFGHYGLFDTNALPKPSLAAFTALALLDGGGAAACGDFTGPTIRVVRPTPGEQFVGKLDIRAAATDDGVGLGRISFFVDDKTDEIRNFTTSLLNDTPVGLTPWQGSGSLGLGRHTIRVVAVDKNGNRSTQDIEVSKVAKLAATLTPTVKLKPARVRCRGRRCTIAGSLVRGVASSPSIDGKVAVSWEFRNSQGRFKRLSGGLRPASKPFTFTAALKRAGRWRVRVTYASVAPWKSAASQYLSFRVG